jgi:tetratricopeptide (TPR) repeat protein
MGELVSLTLGPRLGLRKATSAAAWYARGLALEASDPSAAMACYQRAVAGRPDLADAHNNLGRLHHDCGALAAAEGCYRLALCNDAGVALYWFNLGVVLEDQDRRAEAIGAYRRALALDPRLADAHYNVARLIEQVARSADLTDEVMLRRAIRHLKQYRDLMRASG